jgi:hypothetical protein
MSHRASIGGPHERLMGPRWATVATRGDESRCSAGCSIFKLVPVALRAFSVQPGSWHSPPGLASPGAGSFAGTGRIEMQAHDDRNRPPRGTHHGCEPPGHVVRHGANASRDRREHRGRPGRRDRERHEASGEAIEVLRDEASFGARSVGRARAVARGHRGVVEEARFGSIRPMAGPPWAPALVVGQR